MDTSLLLAQAGNQNTVVEDSVLGSKFFNPDYLFNQGYTFFRQFFNFVNNSDAQIASFYHGLLFLLALFFLTVICYTSIRMFEIRKKEHQYLEQGIREYAHHQAEKEKKSKEEADVSKNEHWIKTLSFLFSQHQSDWKLAVVEADLMLDELMSQLGFRGENLGEKLKGATQEKFHNLSSAWEAHAVRNRIAHEGASFLLTQREAKRVIALYEKIFREFGFI